MKKIISFSVVLGMLPSLTFAAASQTIFGIIAIVNQILAFVIPVLITLAVVYFIWGVISFTIANDEEAKKRGRSMIINGLIGLFVIIAFWGIIRIFTTTFGIDRGQLTEQEIPCIPNAAMGITCP